MGIDQRDLAEDQTRFETVGQCGDGCEMVLRWDTIVADNGAPLLKAVLRVALLVLRGDVFDGTHGVVENLRRVLMEATDGQARARGDGTFRGGILTAHELQQR